MISVHSVNLRAKVHIKSDTDWRRSSVSGRRWKDTLDLYLFFATTDSKVSKSALFVKKPRTEKLEFPSFPGAHTHEFSLNPLSVMRWERATETRVTRIRKRGRKGEKEKNRDKREEDSNQSGYFFIPITELLFGFMLFSRIKQQKGRELKIKIAKSTSLQMHLLNNDWPLACCMKGLHSISFNHQCDLVCSRLSIFILEERRYMQGSFVVAIDKLVLLLCQYRQSQRWLLKKPKYIYMQNRWILESELTMWPCEHCSSCQRCSARIVLALAGFHGLVFTWVYNIELVPTDCLLQGTAQ